LYVGQIAFALRQVESGASMAEIFRKMGVSEPTFYRWNKQFAGMGVADIRRLQQLEEETAKLKRLVADLTLDKSMLQGSDHWPGRCAERDDARRSPPGRAPSARRLRRG
jgi:putative transposase